MKHEAIGGALALGILGGVAGGVAEVAWISLYAAMTGIDAASVARGVTDTLRLGTQAPVGAGIAIHMSLAAMLGLAIAFALRPLRGRVHGIVFYAAVTSALAAVWAVNFLVVLPVINPAFVTIVPLAVSFFSKLLFGVAAAWSLQIADRAANAAQPAFGPFGSRRLRATPDRNPSP